MAEILSDALKEDQCEWLLRLVVSLIDEEKQERLGQIIFPSKNRFLGLTPYPTTERNMLVIGRVRRG
jgi:hypothetical protein